MEVMLVLNGYEIAAGIDEQEEVITDVASGTLSRDDFASWVEGRIVERLNDAK
jgi:prophage maintenance system killer protein